MAERYHDPLLRITQKLRVEHPNAPLFLILDFTNLAMSHADGPEGVTPTILAFGAQPRLPIWNYEQQPQTVTNRMDLIQIARREYETIVAKLRIRRALHSASPNETALDLTSGAEVLVYREKDGWKGPYIFLYRDGRLSVVIDDKEYEHLFHNTMIKPYTRTNLLIEDLLNPADSDETDTGISVHYPQTVKNSNDPRFKKPKKKSMMGSKQRVALFPSIVLNYRLIRTLSEIVSYLASKTLAKRLNA